MRHCNTCKHIAIWHCFHPKHFSKKKSFHESEGLDCPDWIEGNIRFIPDEKGYCHKCKQEVQLDDLVSIAKGIFHCKKCKEN